MKPNHQIPVDVLCIGHAAMDLVFSVEHHPGADEKLFAEDFTSCGGGPAANAAVTVARLGGRAAFAGYAGNDPLGERLLNEFNRDKVNTDLLKRGNGATPLSVILVKPNGDRAVVNYNKQVEPLHLSDLYTKWLQTSQPRVILFDGHEPEISPAVAQLAKTMNIITVLDAGSVRSGTVSLAGMVDYLVCSSRFAFDYTHTNDPRQAIAELTKVNSQVIITLGNQGLLWTKDNTTGSMAAFPIAAVDTTGAGDVFHGAFAFCLAKQYRWENSLHFSSAAAALCCTKIGARPGIPTLKDVKDFLRNQAPAKSTSINKPEK